MICGIGVDLLNRETIPLPCLHPEDPFLRRTFTEKEIQLGMSREHPEDFFPWQVCCEGGSVQEFWPLTAEVEGDRDPVVAVRSTLRHAAWEDG